MVQEHHRAAGTPKFLEQQHLVCVLAGQAVGGEHGDDLDGPVADSVAQGIQARTIEPCAAVPLVAEDVLGGEIVAVLDGPGAQGGELALDGLLTLLAFGGHPGVDGGTHGSPPWPVRGRRRAVDVAVAAGCSRRVAAPRAAAVREEPAVDLVQPGRPVAGPQRDRSDRPAWPLGAEPTATQHRAEPPAEPPEEARPAAQFSWSPAAEAGATEFGAGQRTEQER